MPVPFEHTTLVMSGSDPRIQKLMDDSNNPGAAEAVAARAGKEQRCTFSVQLTSVTGE